MKKPDGVELALLHALRYEEATFKTVDAEKRWGVTKDEEQIVLKWINARMNDIKERLDD